MSTKTTTKGAKLIRYNLSDKDILSAHRLWRRTKWGNRVYLISCLILIVLISAYAELMYDDLNMQMLMRIVRVPLSIALLSLAAGFIASRAALRNFKARFQANKPIELSWNNDTITFEQGVSLWRVPLQDFGSWAMNDSILLILRRGAIWDPIPLRALTHDRQADLLDTFTKAGITRAKLFPF